ncbi:MAG TPA: DNA-3-methyladenine glycosylase [Ktedonobacteraceae bacterium]|jgi:DNA-3-methyladenine glycosylase II|nr:DNA-3-methyladenine glycosylase [Ktedonobacteraceae bacterium]
MTTWENIVNTATAYLRDLDPIMAEAIERVGPCTLQPNPNLFETLVDAIISQQISVKAADAIMARVRKAVPGENGGLITPEAMLPLDQDVLRGAGVSPQKIRYLRDLTERVTSGELNLEALSEMDDEAVIQELVKVKGIGRWTAEMMLIFSLGRPDVLPVDDLGFLEGVREAYKLETRPTPKELRERGELWRPYRTFATWYMWGVRRISLKIQKEKTRIVSL